MEPVGIQKIDVGIVGGGPAGISAAIELSRKAGLTICLFENEAQVGGIPGSSHLFFGMRDLHRVYSGKHYARKLRQRLEATGVTVLTGTTIVKLEADKEETPLLHAVSKDGYAKYACRAVVLATGCCERSRESRRIPGDRVSGIFTTGQLQELVNRQGLVPGRRAVIVGSEIVALSAMLTLKKAGISIEAVIEENVDLKTNRWLVEPFCRLCGCTVYKEVHHIAIKGDARVERVSIRRGRTAETKEIPCDTVVVTGDFRPESQLIDGTPIRLNPETEGPVTDAGLMTSARHVYAAGNVIRGAKMHDLCALEGRQVAQNILRNEGVATGGQIHA